MVFEQQIQEANDDIERLVSRTSQS